MTINTNHAIISLAKGHKKACFSFAIRKEGCFSKNSSKTIAKNSSKAIAKKVLVKQQNIVSETDKKFVSWKIPVERPKRRLHLDKSWNRRIEDE